MPYPFAHPAAVLPLVRPMGRFGVASALVIGSVVPDLWYFFPSVDRSDTHVGAALFWFCVPVGLALYGIFHVLLKEPLIALLSPRLGSFTPPGLPTAPWYAVLASLFVGAVTHLVWDGLTHSNDHSVHGHNWVQHANTALGTAVLVWWVWRKLRRTPWTASRAAFSPFARAWIFIALVAAMAISAWVSLAASDIPATKRVLKTAGMAGVEGFCLALLVYCVLFHCSGRIELKRSINR